MKRVKKTIKVKNRLGLHARPASMIAKMLQGYVAAVSVRYKDQIVDARSIMNLLTLGIQKNCTIELEAVGKDALEAMETLLAAFASEFGERQI
ncbi:MAG: HPr family phosphocarrier protein [Verrucomicrobia bacterium]|nr:HPr family phosphocarrier protein [Verrucomicrobiota bacterium]